MSDFQKKLEEAASRPNASFERKDIFSVGKWFFDLIQEALENSDLKGLTREDFLKYVSDAYDKFVLPIDLPGPDVVLDPLLKAMLMRAAENLWNKLNPQKVFG